jgi:hypothetical protein
MSQIVGHVKGKSDPYAHTHEFTLKRDGVANLDAAASNQAAAQ